jgi:hypothetical protein
MTGGRINSHLSRDPADVRVHTQYYRSQDLGDYRRRPLVCLYFAAGRILIGAASQSGY